MDNYNTGKNFNEPTIRSHRLQDGAYPVRQLVLLGLAHGF